MAKSETTRISLLMRVRDLADWRSWDEFDAIYRPLISGYLGGLGVKRFDVEDLTQEVLRRLIARLPTLEVDRRRARFRTYLWKITYNALVDGARRRKVRDRAEDEWVRRFSDADWSLGRTLKETWILQHRRRILEVVWPQAQASASPTAWACFEGTLIQRRPAAEIAAELGITKNAVYVHAHRVLKDVRRLCAEIEGEQGDGCDLDPS
jgi:RNA polymerase sigma-70 factor (ECF subfamily)